MLLLYTCHYREVLVSAMACSPQMLFCSHSLFPSEPRAAELNSCSSSGVLTPCLPSFCKCATLQSFTGRERDHRTFSRRIYVVVPHSKRYSLWPPFLSWNTNSGLSRSNGQTYRLTNRQSVQQCQNLGTQVHLQEKIIRWVFLSEQQARGMPQNTTALHCIQLTLSISL